MKRAPRNNRRYGAEIIQWIKAQYFRTRQSVRSIARTVGCHENLVRRIVRGEIYADMP